MAIWKFQHSFYPPGTGTHGINPLELTTADIANAAIVEIVQTSMTASPFGLLLDQLLDPSDGYFRWIARLGQVRETRTALSGLFGRFVARAYLTRYAGFDYFGPLTSKMQPVWGGLFIHQPVTGDLPDWVVAAAQGSPNIAIAEAKGSHNKAGVEKALTAAINQAARAHLKSPSGGLRTKRFAVATRWAVVGDPALNKPWLSVHDPDDGYREPSPVELDQLSRGVALAHYAAIAGGLGFLSVERTLSLAAKEGNPQLKFEQDAFTTVIVDGEPQSVIAAMVTPQGVIPLPMDNGNEFQRGIKAVFGDKALLLTVDKATLLAAALGVRPGTTKMPDEGASLADFWRFGRSSIDGTALLPLDRVQILGLREKPPMLESDQ